MYRRYVSVLSHIDAKDEMRPISFSILFGKRKIMQMNDRPSKDNVWANEHARPREHTTLVVS